MRPGVSVAAVRPRRDGRLFGRMRGYGFTRVNLSWDKSIFVGGRQGVPLYFCRETRSAGLLAEERPVRRMTVGRDSGRNPENAPGSGAERGRWNRGGASDPGGLPFRNPGRETFTLEKNTGVMNYLKNGFLSLVFLLACLLYTSDAADE